MGSDSLDRKPSQHSTVFLDFEIFIECWDGLGSRSTVPCDKGTVPLSHRKDRADGADIAKLMKALHSPETKKFIEEKYKGAVVPAF